VDLLPSTTHFNPRREAVRRFGYLRPQLAH